MEKQYWNSYHCLNEIQTDGERVYGNYCKNRVCLVCNGNRKADLINTYYPILSQWNEAYFVTLTLKSVPAQDLPKYILAMKRALNRIISKYRKRHQRGKDIKLKGIRSLESNFNPVKLTYNPHFHLIVPDRKTATILVKEWRHYCNRNAFRAHWKAQDISKVSNIERCLIEVIKYGTKIFTRPDMDESTIKTIPSVVYLCAMHNILSAMKGIRLFDRFGFDIPKENKKAAIPYKVLDQYDEFIYSIKKADWLGVEDDESLTQFIAPLDLKEFCKRLDLTKE